MRKITDGQFDDLRRIYAKLSELLASIGNAPSDVSPEVLAVTEDLMRRKICLACRMPIPDGDRSRRGVDSACYSTIRARIARGETTEAEQVKLGKMAAGTKRAGRPAKQDFVQNAIERNQSDQVKADKKLPKKNS